MYDKTMVVDVVSLYHKAGESCLFCPLVTLFLFSRQIGTPLRAINHKS